MNIIEYPLPVLASNSEDYSEECYFLLDLPEDKQGVSGEEIHLYLNLELACVPLQELVENDEIAQCVTVHCPSTSYRRMYKAKHGESSLDISIEKLNVADKVELRAYLIANKEIADFKPKELNQDFFAGIVFDVARGDVLAESNKSVVYLDSTELEKPIASIFNVKHGEIDESIEVDFSDTETGKIEITLKEDLCQKYKTLGEGYKAETQRFLAGVVVFPVLVEALERIRQNPYEFEELRWFDALTNKLAKLGISVTELPESSTGLADRLLGNVINGSIDDYMRILEELSGSDEAMMRSVD